METAGKYYLTWRWMLGGVFFIAGTYKIFLPLMSKGNSKVIPSLGKLWHRKEFVFFLLLVAHGKLLTNEERKRRGMSNYPFCECYGLCIESVIHVVQDCWFAQVVWKSIIPRFN